jgi:hypothetical protein
MERALKLVKSDGILGFRLGDTMEEVFSRISNLKLLSKEEINDEIQLVENIGDSESHVIVVGQRLFEDVSSVYLNLSHKRLYSIIVNIKHLLFVTPEQQLKQLCDTLSLVIGQTPNIILCNLYTWNLSSHDIILSYGTDFDVTDEICLSFDNNKQ